MSDDTKGSDITALISELRRVSLENVVAQGKQEPAQKEALAVNGHGASTSPEKEGKEAGEQPKKKKNKKPLPIKGLEYIVPSTENEGKDRILTSWRIADHAYLKETELLPTRARGLFTETMYNEQGEIVEERIVTRGYDKFFNVDEVSWTQWENMQETTKGPYYLTVKSNGCIIFMSALSPKELLVTSKHSLGKLKDQDMSHAEKGEEWLEKTLRLAGKTKEDFAAYLWKTKSTAVAELCDDSFEEHVLAYSAEETGLHLHGINLNTRYLNTLPPADVTTIANEYGFIATEYLTFETLDQVKTFTDECAKTGTWKNKNIEGFVVRSHHQDSSLEKSNMFLFKVKFEEPYLRWRKWREYTRKMISHIEHREAGLQSTDKKVRDRALAPPDTGTVHGIKISSIKNDEDTLAYVDWVAQALDEHREWFNDWQEGKGVVRIREMFMEHERKNGRKIRSHEPEDVKEFDRTLLVPVAVPGCGKTLMSLALVQLFGFGHTQSDDIAAKSTKKLFQSTVLEKIKKDKILIADRNNHEVQHRQALLNLVVNPGFAKVHKVRMIALCWDVDKVPGNVLQRICSDRILVRGENHQSLRADEESKVHELILQRFVNQYQPFDQVLNGDSDGAYDEVVHINPELSKLEMLHAIIDSLVPLLSLKRPSNEDIANALETAEAYKPSLRKDQLEDTYKIRYYGIALEIDLRCFLEPFFDNQTHLLTELIKKDRVEKKPHITIVHEKEVSNTELPETEQQVFKQLWKNCQLLALKNQDVNVVLGPRLMWDRRVMCLEMSNLEPADRFGDANRMKAFHVTIGTASADINGVEGKWLMEAVQKGETQSKAGGDIAVLDIGTHSAQGRVRGLC